MYPLQSESYNELRSHLLLRQPVAAPHFADLVTFLVPAGGTVATVVLPLTARALPAPLPLLLGGFLLGVGLVASGQAAVVQVVQPGRAVIADVSRGLEGLRQPGDGVRGGVGGGDGRHLARGVRQTWVGLRPHRPHGVVGL